MESKLEINQYGTKRWKLPNGKLHRESGPAVYKISGTKYWFINGKRHREDGPAVEYFDGNKEWWLNGKLHREDGPAIEYKDGYKEYCLNHVVCSEQEYKNKMRLNKLKHIL